MEAKTLIWAWPTRIFHWMLAIGFASAYLLSEAENFRQFHFAFGAMVGALVLIRIVYGFVGPRYSRFSDFPVGLKNLISFIKNPFSKHFFTGHNPMASWVMLGIMFAGVFTAISGYMTYSNASQVAGTALGEENSKEIHEIFANTFLVLIVLHLAGVLGDFMLHGKAGAFLSIFTGFKQVEAKPATLNKFQRLFGILWVFVSFIIFYFAYNLTPIEKNSTYKDARVEYEQSEKDED